jgi:hypothetical protein
MTDSVRQEIADLLDLPAEVLEPTAEEVELRRRFEEYRAELPGRLARAAADATEIGHREGWLPANMTIEVVS